jgi:hypothetical protein
MVGFREPTFRKIRNKFKKLKYNLKNTSNSFEPNQYVPTCAPSVNLDMSN